jgi:hypothetical protein
MIGIGNKILITASKITEIWGTDVVEVSNPTTGEVWMDRNIGATRAATSKTDSNAYGHLFQWGRDSDGHESRTSDTTTTQSSSDSPGHDDFIIGSTDWRDPQNDNLWQSAIKGDWRLPTDAEWEAEIATWDTEDDAGAYASVLKLPMAGVRLRSDGSLYVVGSRGYYWSSTVDVAHVQFLFLSSSNATMYKDYRAMGFSVRLIKNT